MTERNLTKELQHWVYNDPEFGDDIEHISYPALIELLTELCDRIEKLEQKLNKSFDKEDFNYQCYVEDYK